MRHARVLLTTAAILGVFGLGYAAAEDMTLTGYYPSPREAYEELITTGDVRLATDSTASVRVGLANPPLSALLHIVGRNEAPPNYLLNAQSSTAADLGFRVREDTRTVSIGADTGNQDRLVVGPGTIAGVPLVDVDIAGGATPFYIDDAGRVAMGSTNPQARLDITSDGGGVAFRVERTQITGAGLTILDSARMGLGIPNPSAPFDIDSCTQFQAGIGSPCLKNIRTRVRVSGGANILLEGDGTNLPFIQLGGIKIIAADPSTLQILSGDFNVAGDINASGTILPAPVDVAENMTMVETKDRPVEPGDVMVVDGDNDETVRLSDRPYDLGVAGIVSTKPGILLGAERDGKALALSGRVPVKVTAEGGPIRRGDLLVTSSKPGYAMRGDPQKVDYGTVIGKALGELGAGEGSIIVLLNE